MIQIELPTLIFKLMDEHLKTAVVFLLALNVFLVLIGMFTDGMTAIVVEAPLTLPLANAYNIDPFHLAAIFLLNLEIGFLVPPVGMNLFVSSIRFDKSVGFVCRAVLPFLAILTVVLMIVTYLPSLSTYLPGQVKSIVIDYYDIDEE